MNGNGRLKDIIADAVDSPLAAVVTMGWRNAWRSPRRSIAAASVVGISAFLAVVACSMQVGGHENLLVSEARQYRGDVHIAGRGFTKGRALEAAFEEDAVPWHALQREIRGIEAFSTRLTASALISSDAASLGATVVGIDPRRDQLVADFSGQVVEGRRLEKNDERDALVGEAFAADLGIAVGDSLDVLLHGHRGSIAAGRFRVMGILRTGEGEVDREVIVVPLAAAQDLFGMQGMITDVVFRLDDFRSAEQVAQYLGIRIDRSDLEISTWREFAATSRTAESFFSGVYGSVLLLALIVTSFTFFSISVAILAERRREMAMLSAVGLYRYQLATIVTVEQITLLSIGIVGALLLSFIVINILYYNPIPLPVSMSEIGRGLGADVTELRFGRKSAVFLSPIAWLSFVSMLTFIYPLTSTLRRSSLEHAPAV